MSLQRVLTLSDLPFTQSAQEGNPSGIVPSLKATGSIGNMQYEAATAGAAGNSISITHQLATYQLPAIPARPTFDGSGSNTANVSTEAEFNTALGDASKQVINVTASITFTSMKTINRSVEIKGQGKATTRLRFDATSAVLQISAGVNNVYVHDIEIYNGGSCVDFSSCINAPTMTTAYQNGSTGLWFENCLFTHSKRGVTISGASWVIKNCDFQPSLAVWGRHRSCGLRLRLYWDFLRHRLHVQGDGHVGRDDQHGATHLRSDGHFRRSDQRYLCTRLRWKSRHSEQHTGQGRRHTSLCASILRLY